MNTPPKLKEMTLLEHLGELRKRLMVVAISILIGSVFAYNYSHELFGFLTGLYYKHFPSSFLIGTGPAEAFMLKLKVSLYAGTVLTAPLIFYQIWLFIAPGLYPEEQKLALPFVGVATALFMGGVWFCHALVLPVTFDFFYDQYQSISVTPSIRVTEHLSMLIQALVGFGIVFELPVVAFVLGRLGVITDKTLIDGFRYAVVIIFIVAAVLTPPDALTQLLMAAPLLVLYGISILILRVTQR